MKGEQMEMVLDTAPPVRTTATIYQFPVDPMVALARRTARELQRTHGPAADRLWRERCRAIQADLKSRGIVGERMSSIIDKFALDVHAELQRIEWRDWYEARGGGDAA